jgi:hypothetical protein
VGVVELEQLDVALAGGEVAGERDVDDLVGAAVENEGRDADVGPAGAGLSIAVASSRKP